MRLAAYPHGAQLNLHAAVERQIAAAAVYADWTLHSFRADPAERGRELVLLFVGLRHTPTDRRDNVWLSWRRAIGGSMLVSGKLLWRATFETTLKRRSWLPLNAKTGATLWADARICDAADTFADAADAAAASARAQCGGSPAEAEAEIMRSTSLHPVRLPPMT